ncbi:IclR family transcriptional regulator [Enemella evansiae]|uniref:IclR family transcriptional regulator n=1 Tax=Enemella evansiae TaxID=2016499 RepID=UPI000B968AC8|nr:IclR family transcriptional regulator [Enemella evansiae]OYO11065.1 IclR family transcriptional regulator [Enemella evansiae]
MTEGVQSVSRAFGLLEAIADAGGELTLTDLAEASGLPMPTIHRLLKTLVAGGYVRQQASRRYALGARLIRLGRQADRQVGVLAQPELRRLVVELGETANLAVLEGDTAVYLAQSPSAHSMRMFTEVGRRVAVHNTGVGKAMLAGLDDAAVLSLLHRTGMEQRTPRSHATPEALLADLAEIRARGYAIDDEEQELGVRCYAMAVPDAELPVALSVSGPVSRVDEAFAARAIPALRAATTRVSAELAASNGG